MISIQLRLTLAACAAALVGAALSHALGFSSLWAILVTGLIAGVAVYYVARMALAPLKSLASKSEAKEGRAVHREFEPIVQAFTQMEANHATALGEMKRLERVRTEFLGNVSHELRTPIFAIQGFIETLLDGAIDDPAVNRDFLERARVQSARLNTLLNDLIDISSIESRAMRMSFRMFDLVPLLKEVLREQEPLAWKRDITLSLVPENDVGMFVYADKERLKQVLINLVDNGIKYNRDGGELIVKFGRSDRDRMIEISVRDTGYGIAPEHLPRLFERFYRVDKDRSRTSAGGTGLGLAIVKHIVEAHHGAIQVSSTVGEGTEFRFALHERPF